LNEKGLISQVPPILAFSSVVDATVHAPALVRHLFNRLEPGGHELVFYDVNRMAGLTELYKYDPQEMIDSVREKMARSFSLSLLTNEHANSRWVVVRNWPAGLESSTEESLGIQWPQDVFSLSHVALPFPENDPLYGGKPDSSNPGIHLGNLAFRGERGTLQVSPAAMLRQRWNLFYDYQQQRILEFLSLQ
jgi:hypothetical protein